MKKIILVAGILLIVVAVAVPGIKKYIMSKHKMPFPPRPVQTAMSYKKDAPVYIEAFGTLTALNDVNITPQVNGQIKGAYFKEGDNVKKDSMLFLIDPAPYQAELEKAQATLLQDQTDLKYKQDTLARNAKLVKDQLISEQDFEKYNTDVLAAEAKIKMDQAAVDVATINLGYCTIVSPVDGVTGKRMVDPGNVVVSNPNTVLVNVKTIDTLYVDFSVPEGNLPMIRSSMSEGTLKIEFSVQGDSNVYNGDIHFINNAVDNTTGTVLLRATVNNSSRKLWAGQFAKIKLILGIEKDAVLIPYEAVCMGQKGEYVFVVKDDNTVEIKTVVTGNHQADDIVVRGVESGIKVVTEGQMGLSPGAAVLDLTTQKEKK